jgi:periplasmic mercuric ion binding protein
VQTCHVTTPELSTARAAGRVMFPAMRMRTFLALGALLCASVAHAAEKTETIKVAGWHSKGDAYKTEAALRAVKGVSNASADFAKGSVTVTYEDTQASRQRLEKAVSDAGYSAAK